LSVFAQSGPPKVTGIEIKHVGPATVSDDLIRANIRVKVGDPFVRFSADDDVRNLYNTGLFYNVRVAEENTLDGVVLTYHLQAKPRLTDIKFSGNEKFKDSKLLKKISSRVGDPLDERKLFTDKQDIQKLYEKKGYQGTKVQYVLNIEEAAGRGTVTFEVNETKKVKIERVDFIGAEAFTQKELRKVIKTRNRWMFSWLTGSGIYKEDEFDLDRERLIEFYQGKGYIDFEITKVELKPDSDKRIVVEIHVKEGRPYKVGSISFTGVTMLNTNVLKPGFDPGPMPPKGPERADWYAARDLNYKFKMKEGDTFTPAGLFTNNNVIEDFYGTKGHIDVRAGSRNLIISKVPNTEKGTIDVEYQVNEGQKSYIEKIEIRGNTKTKDRVIRRELAVSPGETFDMVRVKLSEQRLQGLQFFEKVEARPEETTIPNRKNLVIGVSEKNTGNVSLGAGFSTVDSIVGYVEFTQGNFDIGNPPYFTGGGQKFRVRVQVGSERQDYTMSFVEPWFLGRKLSLGVDLYHRELDFQSAENLYDEARTGAKVGLTRALGSDFLIGSVSYKIEQVGILDVSTNAPPSIAAEEGRSLLSTVGASLAFDTRNSVLLPNRGQRTELFGELTGGPFGGDEDFYKLELKTAWYFKGLFSGHVLEVVGRIGVGDGLTGSKDIPFYERYYLGGLYSLRGFDYREIGPREPLADGSAFEPVGGKTYWFGTAEYSIPIIERLRFAVFYDVGMVYPDAFSFSPDPSRGPGYDTGTYADNWGLGLRLNLPIGPLRLDYGFPINAPNGVDDNGQFQFGVGYTREF
jgi:outer membrane protein insertion porin family